MTNPVPLNPLLHPADLLANVRAEIRRLKAIEAEGSPQPSDLVTFLEKSPRDDEPIYKGDKSSVVKPGSAEVSTEPAKENKGGVEEKKSKGEDKKSGGEDKK